LEVHPHGVRVFRNDGQESLRRLVGTIRSLLPILDGAERQMKTLCELLCVNGSAFLPAMVQNKRTFVSGF
jgi:hypothetical protein